jgi:polyisoprenyl-teichoic acid--peptidoglycan teichoic acid transferase
LSMIEETRLTNKPNNDFSFSWWVLTIFISFIISAIIIWIIHITWHPSIQEITKSIPGTINIFQSDSNSPALAHIKKKTVILAMGVDSNGRGTDPFKGTRTDTMIVVTMDPRSKTVNAISIPRDSKVYLADNKGIDKINAAHAYGGPELTVKTVEQTLGINVDHYMVVDYNGLKEIVRALGGVEVFVEKKMRYTDRAAGLYINLEPGKQVLDADKAEMYLRFRHDAEGDIGRIKRQQWFLKGVLEKVKNPTIIFKLPQLIELSKKYTQTDMSLANMMKIAGFMKEINLDKVQVATLPGSPSQYSSISYWLIDVNKAQTLIDRMVFGYEDGEIIKNNNKENNFTISILFNPESQEELDGLVSKLESSNYQVVCKSKSKEVHTKIMAHSSKATLDETNLLKQNTAMLRNVPTFISPDEVFCAPSDFTIVLGQD